MSTAYAHGTNNAFGKDYPVIWKRESGGFSCSADDGQRWYSVGYTPKNTRTTTIGDWQEFSLGSVGNPQVVNDTDLFAVYLNDISKGAKQMSTQDNKASQAVFSLGDKAHHNGTEITIKTAPYELYGAFWQDGVSAAGKTITVPTPSQDAENVKKHQDAWKEQQAAFAKLNHNN